MTILITGSNGFIGRNLHDYFSKIAKYGEAFSWYNTSKTLRDDTNINCMLDLTNLVATKKVLENIKPKYIVHLAGYSTSRPASDDPSKIIRENVIATQNLLEAIPEGTKPNIVFASSILVYGEKSRKEIDICEPTSVYGISKLACENLLKVYSHKLNRAVSLRLCAVVGEKYLTHGMLYDFFQRASTSVTKGQYFDVIGTRPGAIKPFIHVDDVCLAIYKALYDYSIAGIYNVCPNDNISVEDVALRILYECADDNSLKRIRWNPNQVWQGDIKNLQFDNSRFENSFFKVPSSIDAINKVVDNYEWNS